MELLYENKEFRLFSTGHDYDFVGIIETKTEEPLTFFFSEEFVAHTEEEESEWDSWDWEDNVDESKTALLDVYEGLKEYDYDTDDGMDETEAIADAFMDCEHVSWYRTRDDKSSGFLSDPTQRGQFLALVKNYCPDRLQDIAWA